MADGKTSSFYPDQGDQPVKRARHVVGDGSIHSGPGLDRAPFCRIQEFTELISPGTIRGSAQAAVRAMIRGSDSTDDNSMFEPTENFS